MRSEEHRTAVYVVCERESVEMVVDNEACKSVGGVAIGEVRPFSREAGKRTDRGQKAL